MFLHETCRNGDTMNPETVAAQYVCRLIAGEQSQGVNKIDAINRVARRCRTSPGSIRNLTYNNTPKKISYNLFSALHSQVESQLRREARALLNELRQHKASNHDIDPDALAEAQALLAKAADLVGRMKP